MKTSHSVKVVFGLTLALLTGPQLRAQPSRAPSAAGGPYHVSRTFEIGGEGGWDYLTVDSEHKLL
ncbi:MAG TPA: hypothetical protein VFE51_16455, partial [Verrucomicrobiae bacterium]|nr:hypothetical protein [Verrucomicrobiae bacterium]